MTETLVDLVRAQLDQAPERPVPPPPRVPGAAGASSPAEGGDPDTLLFLLGDIEADLRSELAELEEELLRRVEVRRWELGVLAPFRPLLAPSRYKGAYGGRGGAKSHFFAERLLRRCMEKTTRVVCVREIQRSLEQSVKRLLEDKILALSLSDHFVVMRDKILGPHDSLIIFQGMQDHTAESIKSLEGFDIAWVEEAQMLSENSLKLLRPTIRKEGSEIWFSWNPQNATDPVDVLLRSASTPPSSTVIETSYKDNPYLSDELRAEIEWDAGRDPEMFAHVWLGAYKKRSDAAVFKHWEEREFETPEDADFLLGGDWGFAVDPSGLVRCFTRPDVPRTLFIDHEVFEVGCEIEDTPALFDSLLCGCQPPLREHCTSPLHGWARRYPIRADSARPETISHMQKHGYPRLEPAKKGPGSIEEGIVFLQSLNIVVHPRCKRTVNELTYYKFKVDKHTGAVLSDLEDDKNHVIDSARYAIEPLRESGGFEMLW